MTANQLRRRPHIWLGLLAGIAAIVGGMLFYSTVATASPAPTIAVAHVVAKPSHHGALPTVVLVHGAFADASGWGGVITRLESRGYPVIAPANPLQPGTRT